MKKVLLKFKRKKGVSLIYVVMAAAALLILSGAVAVAASRNVDLTMNSSKNRSAYISCKSAIEFAKGIVAQEYEAAEAAGRDSGTPQEIKNNHFQDFKLTPGKTPYKWEDGIQTIDGKTCFATCEITPDGSTDYKYNIAITAGYPSSATNGGKLLKMTYKTSCTLKKSGGSTNKIQYLLYGAKYGKHELIVDYGPNTREPTFFSNINDATGKGISDYPVVFNLPVQASERATGECSFKAPQAFFMAEAWPAGSGGRHDTVDDMSNASIFCYETAVTKIDSNFIYIAGDITYKKGAKLSIKPENDGDTAYIYFAKDCTIYNTENGKKSNTDGYYGTITINKGLYKFTDKKYIIYSDSSNHYSEIKSDMEIRDSDKNNIKANILKVNNVAYVKNNHLALTSSERDDAPTSPYTNGKGDCTYNGKITGSIGTGYKDNDVYMYVDGKNADPTSMWTNSNKCIYPANQISLIYVTHNDTQDPVIKIGAGGSSNTGVEFKANTVSLSGQKQDGAGTNADSLTLSQVGTGEFILSSANGADLVNVILYHKLVVKKSDGSVNYSLNPGTYTVASGTNLFDASVSDFTAVGESGSPIGGGSPGSPGGFGGGEYS